MDVILIPGLWLDGSSWAAVAEGLDDYGLTTHPITLPGTGPGSAEAAKVDLDDLVGAVVEVLDQCLGDVLVVGHSAACGLAYAVVDARPGSVTAVAYVGGFPTPPGTPLIDLPVVDGVIRFPGLDAFDEADVRDLDAAARESFAAAAAPAPGCLATDPLVLTDDARYDVPVVMVCPEYTPDDVRAWVEAGEPNVSELARFADVSYIDIDTGHWPQLTAPDVLARALLDAAGYEPVDDETDGDDAAAGDPDPLVAGAVVPGEVVEAPVVQPSTPAG